MIDTKKTICNKVLIAFVFIFVLLPNNTESVFHINDKLVGKVLLKALVKHKIFIF